VKPIANLSLEELAALVCQSLHDIGITVTLTGGACVAIWSRGKYVSRDLDFIEEGLVPRSKIRKVLKKLGFEEDGRHFTHPKTKFFVEFPAGPLMAGEERIERVRRRRTSAGTLRLLAPTDCIKDRLAAFYHWKDRQSLDQAVLVASTQKIDMNDIRRWSRSEGHEAGFAIFHAKVRSRSPKRVKRHEA
jgi:hypothetical protein